MPESRVAIEAGIVCCCAAAMLAPLSARENTAPAVRQPPGFHDTVPDYAGIRHAALVRIVRDPFKSEIRSEIRKTLSPSLFPSHVELKAIVAGPRPLALVEENGIPRVLGVKDHLENTSVVAIDGNSVRLSNGTVLRIQ